MDVITKIVEGVVARMIGEEFKAWSPTIAQWLLHHAVNQLPKSQRERFSEEWQSHLEETPGSIGKVMTAFGFVFAAINISGGVIRSRQRTLNPRRRMFDIAASSLILVFLAPLLVILSVLVWQDTRSSIVTRKRPSPNGLCPITFLCFQTHRLDPATGKMKITSLGRFLMRTDFYRLPALIEVLQGNLTLVGSLSIMVAPRKEKH